jgi:branched-chain amino acid transport system permease protein
MRRDRFADLITVLIAAFGLFIVMFGGKPYLTQAVIWTALDIALAISLRFMLLVGEVNLGIGAFFGFGAYTAALLSLRLGVPTPAAILAAGAVACVASVPFGYLTLRVSGHYFMLVSFALTEIARLVYTKSSLLGGNSGLVGIVPDLAGFPYLVLGICASVFAALVALERSHLGRIFAAISENADIVRAVGIPVAAVKLLCLAISSFTAGLAGASFAFTNTVIAPGDFGFLLPVFALAYVKIGGDGHPLGAVLGAVTLAVLSQLVIGLGAEDTLLYGTAIVLTMLFMPRGIVGLLLRPSRRRPTGQRPT